MLSTFKGDPVYFPEWSVRASVFFCFCWRASVQEVRGCVHMDMLCAHDVSYVSVLSGTYLSRCLAFEDSDDTIAEGMGLDGLAGILLATC